jgi:hypothetical protein
MHLPIPSEVTQSQIFDHPENRPSEVSLPISLLTTDGSEFTKALCPGITRDIFEGLYSPNQDQLENRLG